MASIVLCAVFIMRVLHIMGGFSNFFYSLDVVMGKKIGEIKICVLC